MRRQVLFVAATASIVFATGWLAISPDTASPDSQDSAKITLAEVASGKAEMIDLGYPLNSRNGFWPAPEYEPFRLKTIATLEKDGVLSKAFSTPEHLGTGTKIRIFMGNSIFPVIPPKPRNSWSRSAAFAGWELIR